MRHACVYAFRWYNTHACMSVCIPPHVGWVMKLRNHGTLDPAAFKKPKAHNIKKWMSGKPDLLGLYGAHFFIEVATWRIRVPSTPKLRNSGPAPKLQPLNPKFDFHPESPWGARASAKEIGFKNFGSFLGNFMVLLEGVTRWVFMLKTLKTQIHKLILKIMKSKN